MKPSPKLFQRFPGNHWLPPTVLSLLLLAVSCQPTQSQKTELSLQIQGSGQTGTYKVSGRTNLPDRSRITVQAIRTLQVVKTQSKLTNTEPTFAVLARSQSTVKDGQWTVELKLRQMLPDGQLLEPWQLNEVQLGLQPDPKVQFSAVTEPSNRNFEIDSAGRNRLSVRFTSDGKSFLQVEDAIALDPPAFKGGKSTDASRFAKPVPIQPADAADNLQPENRGALPSGAVMR
jgi:hypothetical protein